MYSFSVHINLIVYYAKNTPFNFRRVHLFTRLMRGFILAVISTILSCISRTDGSDETKPYGIES